MKMTHTKDGAKKLTRYYLGNCYEIDQRPPSYQSEKLYLGGDFYTAPVVYMKNGSGNWELHYICRDNLGSITRTIAPTGYVIQELNYDAWGRLRTRNHELYPPEKEQSTFLGRGYTGHEILPEYGLINMNARLYDPALGRFLSPDPYVQFPESSQSFNRYTYAMNNPLSYIDRNGEIAWLIPTAFAIAGAYLGGTASNRGQLNPLKWNFKAATTYLGIALGAATGYMGGYGIVHPGSVVFVGGVSSPYISAGIALWGLGDGTDWKFDFHWSTSAGGGGGVTNSVYNPEQATDNSIKKAQWNYRSYKYASTLSLGVLANDATIVGIADDWLIPTAYATASVCFLMDNKELIAREARDIARIMAKNQIWRNGETYQLEARESGWYPNVRGGNVYLQKGDVWKYGQTISKHRYTKKYLNSLGLEQVTIFQGTQMEILIHEKVMLYGYYSEYGHLPPGNSIFR